MRNCIRRFSNRYITLLLVSLLSISVKSQSFSVTTEVNGGTPVHVNNEWHALLNNTKVNLTVNFDNGGLDITSASVLYEGMGLSGSQTILDGSCNISLDVPSSYADNSFTISLKVVYDYQTPHMVDDLDEHNNPTGTQHQEGFDSHVGNELPTQESEKVNIYSNPQSNTTENNKIYTFENYPVAFSVSGGNITGWKTKYADDAERSDLTVILRKPTESILVEKTEKISVINYAPDGITQWGSQEYVFDVYYYDTPTCVPDPSNPTEVLFYKNTGDNAWTVSVNGGNPSGWIYSWSGGAASGAAKDYRPFTSDVETSQLSSYLTVHVKNVVGEKVLFEQDVTVATISVYPEATCVPDPSNPTEVYFYKNTGENTWTVSVNGGNSSGWIYSWSGGAASSAEKDYRPFTSDVETSQLSSNLTVHVKNVVGEKVLFEQDVTVATISVYPEATCVPDPSNPTEVLFYKNTGDNAWTVSVNGGNPSGWIYSWSGGAASGAAKDYRPFTSDVETSQLSSNLTVHVKNVVGEKVLFEQDVTVATISVYPEATCVPDPSNPTEVYFYKNTGENTWTVSVNGGNSSGWIYSWSGGAASSAEKDYRPFTSDVETSQLSSNLTVHVKNVVGEKVLFEQDVTVATISVYPEATCVPDPSNPTEVYFYKNTGENTWTVSVNGGNSSGWMYSWSGGAASGAAKDYRPFTSDVETSQLSSNLTVHVKNVVGEKVLFEQDVTVATISVYSELTEQDVLKIDAKDVLSYKGETNVFLTEWDAPKEYPGTWQFQWFEGETALTGSLSSILSIVPSKNSIFSIKASYLYNGIEWCSFKKSYNAYVYERPSASISETVSLIKLDNDNVSSPIDGAVPKTADGSDLAPMTLNYESKQVRGDDYEMILGDKIKFDVLTSGGADDWEYLITVDHHSVTDAPFITFEPTTAREYLVTIEVSNGSNLINPYTAIATRKIKVYPKPDASVSLSEVSLYGGQKYTVKKHIGSGGHQEGWTLSNWSDGVSKDERDCGTTSDVNKKSNLSYSYTTDYYCSGYQRCSVTNGYDFTIWPQPIVSAFSVKLVDKEINTEKNIIYYDDPAAYEKVIDCYAGDRLIVNFQIKGGYADATSGNWDYTITHNGIVLVSGDISLSDINTKATGASTTTLEIPIASNKYDTHHYAVKMRNRVSDGVTHGSDTWYDCNYKLDVNAWKVPDISFVLNDSTGTSWSSTSTANRINVYAGGYNSNNVNFVIPKIAGYDQGWTYTWKLDNSHESSVQERWTYIPKTTKSYEDKMVTVEVSNSIGANKGMSDKVMKYYIRVWHKANIPDNFVITDATQDRVLTGDYVAIRENNTLKYHVDAITYGYRPSMSNSSYSYVWSDGPVGTDVTDWEEIATGDFSVKDEYSSVTKTMGLVVANYGPYGNVWDGSSSVQNYYVYQRPKTPLSVSRKGSGKTGTLVCTTNISDADLQGHQYYIVFGYVSNGSDIDVAEQKQNGPGQSRWAQNEVFKNDAVYYAYAKWVNSDGTIITSGKCYSDGSVNESWDGTVFNKSTRSSLRDFNADDLTVIPTLYQSEEVDEVDGSVKISSVYDMHGHVIGTSLQNLSPGLYVVRYLNGDCKKILVK